MFIGINGKHEISLSLDLSSIRIRVTFNPLKDNPSLGAIS